MHAWEGLSRPTTGNVLTAPTLVGAAAAGAVVWGEWGVGGGVAVVVEFGDGVAELDAGGVAVALEHAVAVDVDVRGRLPVGVDRVGGAAAVEVVVLDPDVRLDPFTPMMIGAVTPPPGDGSIVLWRTTMLSAPGDICSPLVCGSLPHTYDGPLVLRSCIQLSTKVTLSPPTFAAFSQPVSSVRRTVKLSSPIALWQLFWPATGRFMISLSSTTSPVLLLVTTHIELERIRDRRIVTFGAFTTTCPVISRASITAPAVEIVIPPEADNTVPAGTPVFDASGKPPLGGGVVVGQPVESTAVPAGVFGH